MGLLLLLTLTTFQPGSQWLQQCPLLQSQLEGIVALPTIILPPAFHVGLALRTQVKVCSLVPDPEKGIAESHTGPDLGPGKSPTP